MDEILASRGPQHRHQAACVSPPVLAAALVAALLAWACSEERNARPGQSTASEQGSVPVGLVPPELAWDFYPHGFTHDALLARLDKASRRSGQLHDDEIWSGVVHITGDVEVNQGLTLTIEPGTLVLVAARTDDQGGGPTGASFDAFNPKDPPIRSSERIELRIQGSLIVRGTREAPVIFTSDAQDPASGDWDGIQLAPGANGQVEIDRAIVEFQRYIGIGAAGVTIRRSILRNMMGCVVIGGDMCAVLDRVPLDMTPVLTQNYIYNTGRHAVTIRSGAPRITHNVIRARPDLDATGWEQGAIGSDVPTCAVIQYNYLDGSAPKVYQGEIFGQHYEYTQPKSAGVNGMCSLTFSYNTLTGSPLALETNAGQWSIEHNNLLPAPAPQSQVAEWLPAGTMLAVVARNWQPEPSDECQIRFLAQIGGIPQAKTVQVPHNYWGTTDPSAIRQLLWSDTKSRAFNYSPFEEDFIAEAMPNWHEFEW